MRREQILVIFRAGYIFVNYDIAPRCISKYRAHVRQFCSKSGVRYVSVKRLRKLEIVIVKVRGRRFSLLRRNQPDMRLVKARATAEIKQDGIEGRGSESILIRIDSY